MNVFPCLKAPIGLPPIVKVCQRVADLYPKNYYAWTQRSWVVLRAVGEATGTPEGNKHRAEKISLVKDLVSVPCTGTICSPVLEREEENAQHDFSEDTLCGDQLHCRLNLCSRARLLSSRCTCSRTWQLQRELDFVDGWLTSHVSDHSALNHRKNIVSALSAVSPGE